MKTFKLSFSLLIALLLCNVTFAQSKTETIKVWGNCGMCKEKIEAAAVKAGATAATWSAETHMLNVSYDESKTSSSKIQKAIAKTGYDTQDFTAKDKAYNKLHACCKYDRKGASEANAVKCCSHENCGKTADCCKGMDCCKDKKCGTQEMAKCCNHENCGKTADCCKGMDCCKDKKCGNATAAACTNHEKCKKDKSCCTSENCGKDAKCCGR